MENFIFSFFSLRVQKSCFPFLTKNIFDCSLRTFLSPVLHRFLCMNFKCEFNLSSQFQTLPQISNNSATAMDNRAKA